MRGPRITTISCVFLCVRSSEPRSLAVHVLPEFLAIDFETTGTVRGFPSLPWQLGAVTLRGGKVDLSAPSFDTFLRVPETWPFSQHAPGNHRSCREAIATAPEAMDVWPLLHERLSAAIPVAHNAATERGVLARFAPMTRYERWIDTLSLARYAWPGLKDYTLETLTQCLGLLPRLETLVPNRGPHDAYYDAVACALLLEYLLMQPGWQAATIEDLVRL